jgi:hypothetical protein
MPLGMKPREERIEGLEIRVARHRGEAPLSPCDHELLPDRFCEVVQPGHPHAAREGEKRRLIPHDGFRGDVLQVAAFAEEPVELRSRTMNMLAIVALIALIAIIIALWRIKRPPPPPPVS